MRRTWGSVVILMAGFALMAGCQNHRQNLKPAKQEEAYNLPPANDAKWDRPIEYPKGTLNQDMVKKDREAKDSGADPRTGASPTQSPRMGMGGGGGGY